MNKTFWEKRKKKLQYSNGQSIGGTSFLQKLLGKLLPSYGIRLAKHQNKQLQNSLFTSHSPPWYWQ